MTSRGKVENMWCLTLSPSPSKNEHFCYIFSRATSHLAFTFLNNYRDIPRVLYAQFYTWDSVSCIVIPTSSCVLLSALNLHLIRPNPIKNMNTFNSYTRISQVCFQLRWKMAYHTVHVLLMFDRALICSTFLSHTTQINLAVKMLR